MIQSTCIDRSLGDEVSLIAVSVGRAHWVIVQLRNIGGYKIRLATVKIISLYELRMLHSGLGVVIPVAIESRWFPYYSEYDAQAESSSQIRTVMRSSDSDEILSFTRDQKIRAKCSMLGFNPSNSGRSLRVASW